MNLYPRSRPPTMFQKLIRPSVPFADILQGVKNITLFLFILVAFGSLSLNASDVPGPLKSRFIIGDPVWKEIPIRDDLQIQYEKCGCVANSVSQTPGRFYAFGRRPDSRGFANWRPHRGVLKA